jgi:tetratricopeptide (TPR) repeat protein
MRSLPFFGVAGLLGSVTVWFQYHRAIADIVRQDSFWSRLAGAGWAVWFYLSKAMVPVNLCFVYPRWQIDPKNIFSYVPALLVAAVLVVCYCNRRGWGNHGLLALGYYVALLIPALGFINIYFMRYSLVADHWQYYSIIGLIALVVSAGTVIAQRGGTWGRNLGTLAAAAMLVALGVTTWKQQHIYMNMEMLWRDTLAKNPNAWLAQNNLGVLLADRGNLSEAMEHCEQALRIEPDYSESHFNLGNALFKAGKVQEAIEHWEQALRINPDLAETHYNLGIALVQLGRTQEGIEHYQQALRIQPDYAKAHNNLGNALVQLDRLQEAIEHCEQALRIKPDFPEAHNNLGIALARVGKVQEAVEHWEQALRINPDYAEAHNNLGLALEKLGRVQEAIQHYEQALRIKPDFVQAQNNLARARTVQ